MVNSKKKVHFIDCGANIGQTVKWVLKKYKNRIHRIDSFEPQTTNFNVLKEAFGNNDSVELHKKAVWTCNEKKKFYIQDWGARTGSSLISGKTSTKTDVFEVVDCIDLAEWIKENTSSENYNILKLDLEGAEYDVLPYLFETKIHDVIDEWLIEFHGKKIPNYNPAIYEEVKKYAKKLVDWGSKEIGEEITKTFKEVNE